MDEQSNYTYIPQATADIKQINNNTDVLTVSLELLWLRIKTICDFKILLDKCMLSHECDSWHAHKEKVPTNKRKKRKREEKSNALMAEFLLAQVSFVSHQCANFLPCTRRRDAICIQMRLFLIDYFFPRERKRENVYGREKGKRGRVACNKGDEKGRDKLRKSVTVSFGIGNI